MKDFLGLKWKVGKSILTVFGKCWHYNCIEIVFIFVDLIEIVLLIEKKICLKPIKNDTANIYKSFQQFVFVFTFFFNAVQSFFFVTYSQLFHFFFILLIFIFWKRIEQVWWVDYRMNWLWLQLKSVNGMIRVYIWEGVEMASDSLSHWFLVIAKHNKVFYYFYFICFFICIHAAFIFISLFYPLNFILILFIICLFIFIF